MKKASEKQQVVMSSYNFFKTSEQVRKLCLNSILFSALSKYNIRCDFLCDFLLLMDVNE
jgi:hypothetical protein